MVINANGKNYAIEIITNLTWITLGQLNQYFC